MSIIDDFISEYIARKSDYETVCNAVQKAIERSLHDAGIMAIPTSRVKDTDRLREKLIERNKKTPYLSNKDIIADIPDFIGARIALYFPNDKEKIATLLVRDFDIEKIKNFPSEQRKYDGYDRRFSGYCATHYRVRFRNPPNTSLGNPLIEIQVASLLMHAWSEVEHDLAYKMKKGLVSYDEYESLDEINGLVIAGEISLQRLQRLSQARIESGKKEITDHYQLSAYLSERAYAITQRKDVFLGDVETLYQLFADKNRLTKGKLDRDLAKIDFNDDTPIAQQLIDIYADKSVKDAARIISNKAKKAPYPDNYIVNDAQIGSFLRKWISLEKKLSDLVKQAGYHANYPGELQHILLHKGLLPESVQNEYIAVKKARNKLVHGLETPTPKEFEAYAQIIDRIMQVLKD